MRSQSRPWMELCAELVNVIVSDHSVEQVRAQKRCPLSRLKTTRYSLDLKIGDFSAIDNYMKLHEIIWRPLYIVLWNFFAKVLFLYYLAYLGTDTDWNSWRKILKNGKGNEAHIINQILQPILRFLIGVSRNKVSLRTSHATAQNCILTLFNLVKNCQKHLHTYHLSK